MSCDACKHCQHMDFTCHYCGKNSRQRQARYDVEAGRVPPVPPAPPVEREGEAPLFGRASRETVSRLQRELAGLHPDDRKVALRNEELCSERDGFIERLLERIHNVTAERDELRSRHAAKGKSRESYPTRAQCQEPPAALADQEREALREARELIDKLAKAVLLPRVPVAGLPDRPCGDAILAVVCARRWLDARKGTP